MSVDHTLSYLTRPDGVSIAYAHAGGGVPLVIVAGWTTHLGYFFGDPSSLLVGPLADHVEVIAYDKHGCGLSDRDRTEFTMESELKDVEALVDHLGLDRFSLLGMSEGGTVAAQFAALYPERVEALALYSCTADGAGLAPEAFRQSFVDIIRASWGVGSSVLTDMLIPDASQEQQREFAQWQRDSASADVAAGMMEMLYGWDIRDQLSMIQADTVVIHRRHSRAFPPSNGRVLAAGIPNATAVVIDGYAHYPPQVGDPHTIDVVNAILGLVADTRAVSPREQPNIHTIVFTDIEDSTRLVEELGDAAAREAMARHDSIVRDATLRNGGTIVKHTGDGFLASFPSASGALRAASEVQVQLHAAGGPATLVRIGIHAGEPIEEDGDIHGTSVIRAARIMDEAQGSQILVSSLVRELVAGRDFDFTDRGMHSLKGIDDSARLHELQWAPDAD